MRVIMTSYSLLRTFYRHMRLEYVSSRSSKIGVLKFTKIVWKNNMISLVVFCLLIANILGRKIFWQPLYMRRADVCSLLAACWFSMYFNKLSNLIVRIVCMNEQKWVYICWVLLQTRVKCPIDTVIYYRGKFTFAWVVCRPYYTVFWLVFVN